MDLSNLNELLTAHFDESASPMQKRMLEELLRSSEGSRRQFWEAASWNYLLETAVMAACLESATDIKGEPLVETPSQRDSADFAHGPQQADVIREEKVSCDSASRAPRYLLRIWSDLDRFVTRHNFGVGVAVAAVLFIVAAIIMPHFGKVRMNVVEEGHETQPTQAEQQQFVALLSDSHAAKWRDEATPRGTQLMVGKRLAIESGVLEVTYNTGARVVIEGPAEFVVGGNSENEQGESRLEARDRRRDANSGFLALGKLVARCETPGSKGFGIATPMAQIVDLGTEFSLAVDARGRSVTSVLSGSVTATPRVGESFDTSQAVTLSAGEQVEVSANGQYVSSVRKLAAEELARLRMSAMPKLVSLVSDNFELPALKWPNDFESHGFVQKVPQGWHAQGTVWIAHEKGPDFRLTEFSGQAVTLGGGDTKLPNGSIVRSLGKTRLGDTILVEFIQAVQGGAANRRKVANVAFEFFDGDPRSGGISIGKLTLVGDFAGQNSIHRREAVVLNKSYDEEVDLYVQISRQPKPKKTGNIVIDQIEISTRLKEPAIDKAP